MATRRLSFWRLQCLGWFIFLVATFPFKLTVFGDPLNALQVTLVRDGTGFLLSLGLWRIYRKWDHRRRGTVWTVLFVLLMSAATEGVESLIAYSLQRGLNFLPGQFNTPFFMFGVFAFRGMLFAVWSLLYFWIKDWRDSQERELCLARAETGKREAELRMLRAQVNPHFLFNALNTVQSGLGREQAALKHVVLGLSEYLRYSLANHDRKWVPLGEEFDAVLQYLRVEQGRYREDLVVEAEIEEGVRARPVPGVILQPLVENAVRYGMEDSERPLRIRLAAKETGDGWIWIEVANSGNWIEPRGLRADGTGGSGLQNLRQRLELLYPQLHELKIGEGRGWVSVSIRLSPQPA